MTPKQTQKQLDARNAEWQVDIDPAIAEIAAQPTPLNDHFERGLSIDQGTLLRYICALERRVAILER